jgi:hypothetical protein
MIGSISKIHFNLAFWHRLYGHICFIFAMDFRMDLEWNLELSYDCL